MAVFLIIIGIIIGLCIYFFILSFTKQFLLKKYGNKSDRTDVEFYSICGVFFPITWPVILIYEISQLPKKLFEEKKIPIIIIEKGAQVSSAKQAEQMRELLNTWDEIKGRIL